MTSITKQMDLGYSYGGTREDPLVKGFVPFVYDTHIHSCLQEALLERTELLLQSLQFEFDSSKDVFDTSAESKARRLRALDVMVATVVFTTANILVQSPGVHYAIMFTRIQEIFKRETSIRDTFGDEIADRVLKILKPVWVDLRAIDNSFGKQEAQGFYEEATVKVVPAAQSTEDDNENTKDEEGAKEDEDTKDEEDHEDTKAAKHDEDEEDDDEEDDEEDEDDDEEDDDEEDDDDEDDYDEDDDDEEDDDEEEDDE